MSDEFWGIVIIQLALIVNRAISSWENRQTHNKLSQLDCKLEGCPMKGTANNGKPRHP